MKIYDLSHQISEKMPVFPGEKEPVINVQSTYSENGYLTHEICFNTHVGTHIDSPAHIIEKGKKLEDLKPEKYFGKAFSYMHNGSEKIEKSEFEEIEGIISSVDFLIINTGWYKFWRSEKYFSGYPVMTVEAARYLCGFNLKGIGVDTISVDRIESDELPVHKTLLKNETIIVENMTNLDNIKSKIFFLSVMPLNVKDTESMPARAVAITDLEKQ